MANREHNPGSPNWCEKCILILEFFGIIGLAVYCVYTIKEWKTFDSERSTMQEEFGVAYTNAQIDERAWVGVDKVEGETVSDDTNEVDFKITFRNTGKTPASNVHIQIHATANDADVLKPDTNTAGGMNGLMLPGSDMCVLSGDTITKADLNSITPETNTIRVYGTIWYDDIFKKGHWTKYCYRPMSRPPFDMVPADNHNSSDE